MMALSALCLALLRALQSKEGQATPTPEGMP